nr:immunoglobulin light chain junction region [Macaca mulatta]
CKQALEYPLTF